MCLSAAFSLLISSAWFTHFDRIPEKVLTGLRFALLVGGLSNTAPPSPPPPPHFCCGSFECLVDLFILGGFLPRAAEPWSMGARHMTKTRNSKNFKKLKKQSINCSLNHFSMPYSDMEKMPPDDICNLNIRKKKYRRVAWLTDHAEVGI